MNASSDHRSLQGPDLGPPLSGDLTPFEREVILSLRKIALEIRGVGSVNEDHLSNIANTIYSVGA
jgi:hypothetical protein